MSENSKSVDKSETKSEKSFASNPPFSLEISPEKLEVPPEGLLEVTIKNPTKQPQYIICYFDSFYFLVDFKNADWHQEGDTPSAAMAYHTLKPGETYTLTIGYDNGKYPEKVRKCSTCNDQKRVVRDDTKKQRLDPKNNIYYNLERPEGVLKIRQRATRMDCPVLLSRDMDIYLSEETEKYRMLKEVYLKIRLDQKRRRRWGETLETRGCATYRYFKLEKDDESEFFRSYEEFKSDNINPETFWGKVLVTRCTPKNLEEFDKVSDDEIMKLKMERQAPYFLRGHIINVDDLQKVVEECWGDECQCGMPRLRTREEMEKYLEAEAKLEKKSVQNVVKSEKPKTIEESKEKSKKSPNKLPPPEKTTPSSKFDNVESANKSSENMKQEEAKIEEKKAPTTPQVAPIPVEKKPVVQEKKNKKKKKGNPCCSVS
ncbi:hypothetical protein CRE_13620 [Caenorhabditis remanei]|uniref:Uncharacterized protein n=1 Tax=Caenorhabditis remanei TaxID=31234 RepID=E3N1B0_CAERE|nr:hypothetical protein CRE_13620 [Caenorhabditis remanei]